MFQVRLHVSSSHYTGNCELSYIGNDMVINGTMLTLSMSSNA